MTFNSYMFILFFLPVVLAGYYVCFFRTSGRMVRVFLLSVSVIFYVSAGWRAAGILLASILLNYAFFRGMAVSRRRQNTGGGVNTF